MKAEGGGGAAELTKAADTRRAGDEAKCATEALRCVGVRSCAPRGGGGRGRSYQ